MNSSRRISHWILTEGEEAIYSSNGGDTVKDNYTTNHSVSVYDRL